MFLAIEKKETVSLKKDSQKENENDGDNDSTGTAADLAPVRGLDGGFRGGGVDKKR